LWPGRLRFVAGVRPMSEHLASWEAADLGRWFELLREAGLSSAEAALLAVTYLQQQRERGRSEAAT